MLSHNSEDTSNPSSSPSILPALVTGAPVQLMRTLVVDPNPVSATALLSLVANRGHESAHCASFAEAAEVVKSAQVDCLLIRLNHATAPDAADLLRTARQVPGHCHIVAVTDGEEPPSRVDAWVKRGFDDFIADPSRGGENLSSARLAIAEHSLMRRRDRERADLDAVRHSRRYEEIFHRSPEAALVVSARDGLIIEANAASESVLGFARGEMQNRYLSLVLPDLFDRDDYDPRVLGVLDTMNISEVRHRRPDSTFCWLDVLITRIPWTPGQALLLKFHDVTALKGRESRRIHEARMDAASRVMAGTARELGDALTSLRGHLELLSRQPAPRQETRELILSATQSCDSAENLSRRLARLARAPQGGELRKRPLHLRPLLDKAVHFALLNSQSRPVVHVPDELWPVEADEAAIEDVLRRISENASDAMPAGGTVFVDAQNLYETGPETGVPSAVRLRFRDQGHGVAPEHLARVFDPWFTTRQGREGMGLAHAAALVRAHGGHMEIDSVHGQGCTVCVWLPVNPGLIAGTVSRLPELPDSGPLPPQIPARNSERRPRVLFMDDDAPIREVVQRILTAHGFDVHCTTNGQEAIDAWRRASDFGSAFDLILVDLDVRGGMGGQECVARLKGEFPGLKALLTTGYIDDVLMDTYRDHGFLGVIPKPFHFDRLVEAIGRIIGVKKVE
ncbi:MAG TPA: response regulator [Verrucomicrobiales bacterium]|nr:response regulator [Verrucomicrobiales bacterium]